MNPTFTFLAGAVVGAIVGGGLGVLAICMLVVGRESE